MGSFSRRVAGAAGTVLAAVGLAAVPSAANAQPAVIVPCDVGRLVAAVHDANLVSDRTLILARNCRYDLTGPFVPAPADPPALRGDSGLRVHKRLTLVGSNTVIRATGPFRVLEVTAGAVLNARGLTITGGDAGTQTGGGILNGRGVVLLSRSLVTGNTADSGAGISNDSGDLSLESSSVRDNTIRSGGGGGGGLYNDGSLSIRLSRVNLNRAGTNGGAIFNEQGGRTVVFRSDIIANTAGGNGGAIYNGVGGNLRGDLIRVQFNQAAGAGGGAFDVAGVSGRVVFTRSVVAGNSAPNCVGDVIGCSR